MVSVDNELLSVYARALRAVADGLDDAMKHEVSAPAPDATAGLTGEQRAAVAGDLLAARRGLRAQKRKGADYHFYRGSVNAIERIVNDLGRADRDAITAAVDRIEGRPSGYMLVAPGSAGK